MATISYWARADSITANNATLNPIGTTGANGVPAFQLTFTDNNGAGDLYIEQPVGGGIDPDTQVIINGVTYNFTLQLTGVLPNNSQVPGALVGETVAVITVNIAGVNREYFFVVGGLTNTNVPITQGLMNQIGNGAIPLTSVDITPPPICFCAGTEIATPSGRRKVETLAAGDVVLTASGAARQIIWIGSSRISRAALQHDSALRPIVISAHALGHGLPAKELRVSPQHRIVFEGGICELLFGEDTVLVPAKFLVGRLAEVAEPTEDVDYFHVLLEDHDMLVSNGLATESFQPARRMIDVMGRAARSLLEAQIEALGAGNFLARKDRHLSLKQAEARVLVDWLERQAGDVASYPSANLHLHS